jgi:hypothetical protein
MSDVTILASVLTSVVGLVGVLVAGLSVYFNYKGRHNQFRQVVYSKQMDAYFEITGTMAHLYNAAQNLFNFGGLRFQSHDDARRHFRTALRDEHEQFNEQVNRWLIVLPSKVKAALDSFNLTLTAVGGSSEGRHGGGHEACLEKTPDHGTELAKAYERAVNCIRHHMAVDSLTMGMLREMGIGAESFSVRSLPMWAVRATPVEAGDPRSR